MIDENKNMDWIAKKNTLTNNELRNLSSVEYSHEAK